MKIIRKMAAFLLVLCVTAALAVPVCALEYASGEDDGPNYGKSTAVVTAPFLDKAETETNKNAERTSNAENAAGTDRLPALGYVAAQLSLIPVAFWCAAKNRNGRRYCT